MAGVYDRSRPNVGAHIEEAIASLNVGEFMSVAEICAFKSTQYPDDSPRPPAGAVAARLYPPSPRVCGLGGVHPVNQEDAPGGRKGARRVAGDQPSTAVTFSDLY